MRIKFISKTGPKLMQLFQRKGKNELCCEAEDCIPCVQAKQSDDPPQNCRKNNIAYSAECKTCEKKNKSRVYYGETSRNLYLRCKEHYSNVNSRQDKSWMVKHIMKEHDGNFDEVNFRWKILGSFKKPLTRQITEAVKIKRSKDEVNLNSKTEFNAQRIKKVIIERTKKTYDCKVCGLMATEESQLDKHDVKFHRKVQCIQCEESCFGERAHHEHMTNNHKAI